MIHTLRGKVEDRDVWLDGEFLDPKESQKVYNHSPDGFNWGYGGSGPAQLALAILLELTDEDLALSHYQEFKWDYISKLPQGEDFEVEFNLEIDPDGMMISLWRDLKVEIKNKEIKR